MPEAHELATNSSPSLRGAIWQSFSRFNSAAILGSGASLPRLFAIKDQHTFHFRLACLFGEIIAFEFAQLLFVWYGIRKTNTTISDLVGGRWSSTWDVAKDTLLAGALWLLWMLATIVLIIAIHPQRHGTPDFLKNAASIHARNQACGSPSPRPPAFAKRSSIEDTFSGNFSRYGKACHSPYLYRP